MDAHSAKSDPNTFLGAETVKKICSDPTHFLTWNLGAISVGGAFITRFRPFLFGWIWVPTSWTWVAKSRIWVPTSGIWVVKSKIGITQSRISERCSLSLKQYIFGEKTKFEPQTGTVWPLELKVAKNTQTRFQVLPKSQFVKFEIGLYILGRIWSLYRKWPPLTPRRSQDMGCALPITWVASVGPRRT